MSEETTQGNQNQNQTHKLNDDDIEIEIEKYKKENEQNIYDKIVKHNLKEQEIKDKMTEAREASDEDEYESLNLQLKEIEEQNKESVDLMKEYIFII